MTRLDATHDPERESWLESANAPDTDFPVQNLPYARFRRQGSDDALSVGVAIGDHGRSSSIVVSGQGVRRPLGQIKTVDAAAALPGQCAQPRGRRD